MKVDGDGRMYTDDVPHAGEPVRSDMKRLLEFLGGRKKREEATVDKQALVDDDPNFVAGRDGAGEDDSVYV